MLGSDREPAGIPRRRWHRKGMRPTGAWLAVIAISSLACAGSGHEAARSDPKPTAADAARAPDNLNIFVMTARQKPRVIESLEAAHLLVTRDLLEAGLMLRVSIGVDQGWKSCGTRNNVAYWLKRDGVTIARFAQKGWTGACTPNVFDALSRQLATHLLALTARETLQETD